MPRVWKRAWIFWSFRRMCQRQLKKLNAPWLRDASPRPTLMPACEKCWQPRRGQVSTSISPSKLKIWWKTSTTKPQNCSTVRWPKKPSRCCKIPMTFYRCGPWIRSALRRCRSLMRPKWPQKLEPLIWGRA